MRALPRAVLLVISIGALYFAPAISSRMAFKHPASAPDLNNFYRSIQALSGDSLIDDREAAIV